MRSLLDLQQRAFVAKAYRRDRSSRVRQRAAARLLRASARAEARYTRDVLGIMRGVHAGVMAAVREEHALPEHQHGELVERMNAARSFPPPGLQQRLFVYIRRHVAPAFDRMAKAVDAENKEGMALLGVSPAIVPGLGGTLAQAREDNIALLQKAAGTYTAQVEEVLRDPDNLGLRVEELAGLLQERGEVSESKAMFIARDQTLKLNAAVTRVRARAAGVSRYDWSTSRDRKVRPMHADLEGTRHSYDDPPVTNEDGDTNNPGEDYECRCVGLPVIPELEEEEPSGTRLGEPGDDEEQAAQ